MAKFDDAEEVLDYFDLKSMRVIKPASPPLPSKTSLTEAIEIAEKIERLQRESRALLEDGTATVGRAQVNRARGRKKTGLGRAEMPFAKPGHVS